MNIAGNRFLPTLAGLVFLVLSCCIGATSAATLPDQGPAPELSRLSGWINSAPLTMSALRGRVVLAEFWTYSCINCIRNLPHVSAWHARYQEKGPSVVGIHTPEFHYEKDADNVATAVRRLGVHYPVAQDNHYASWNAFSNQYWPAVYLIDRKGRIRYKHFGEGQYQQTDLAIQQLLAEK